MRLTMGLFAQGNTNDMNNKNAVMMNPQLMHRVAATRAFLADYEEQESHNQPISFGLTVGYPLNTWLSLSSGLVYTKLNSTFTTLMPNHQIQRHQKLHYIGVPLNLQAHLLQWHGISLYLTAGAQADWNIKAESNTDGVNQVMDKDRMQWSIGGSLGLAYHIIPHEETIITLTTYPLFDGKRTNQRKARQEYLSRVSWCTLRIWHQLRLAI